MIDRVIYLLSAIASTYSILCKHSSNGARVDTQVSAIVRTQLSPNYSSAFLYDDCYDYRPICPLVIVLYSTLRSRLYPCVWSYSSSPTAVHVSFSYRIGPAPVSIWPQWIWSAYWRLTHPPVPNSQLPRNCVEPQSHHNSPPWSTVAV